jgi:signal transduction histidine kinase
MWERIVHRAGWTGYLPWVGGLLVLAFGLLAGLLPRSLPSGVAGTLLTVAMGAAAGYAAWRSAGGLAPTGARRAWAFLGTALALWTVAAALRGLGWILAGRLLPTPSIVDLLRLAGYLSILGASAAYPVAPPERFSRARELLDQAILGLAVLTLSWLVILRPVIGSTMADPIVAFWACLPPVADLLLFTWILRLLLLSGPRNESRAFGMLLAASVVLLAGDLGNGYMILQGQAAAGTVVDATWSAAYLLIAVASLERAQPDSIHAEGQFPASRPLAQRFEPLLPIALTYAVVGYTVIDWRLIGTLDWGGLGGAVALSLLLVSRQGILQGQTEMRQFAAMVHATTDLAFICDADGNVSLSNPAMEAALGNSAPASASEFLVASAPFETVLSTGILLGWAGEAAFKRSDGSTFPVSLSLQPIWDERRGLPLLVGTAHDLTRVKEREVALRAALEQVAAARLELQDLNQALEAKVDSRTRELADTVDHLARVNEDLKQLDRLKTEFVTLVSHELRAPLTNIRAGIELILETHPGLPTEVSDPLGLVQAETGRLGRFVETILDLSALEAGGFPLRPEPLPVADIARAVCQRFPATGGFTRLRLEVPPALPEVMADERALASVFFHLVDNALKYAPDGEVIVEAQVDGERVRMAVRDHGPGIPREERERVFEMFHRLDTRDNREVYGHGLGLHLARLLVQGMGGGMHAEEAEAGGARIVFWLPRAPEGAAEPRDVQAQPQPQPQPREAA